MLAWTVAAALAAVVVFYYGQKAYGVLYERRTERLRCTQEGFYAAAHAVLANPALDERHLKFVRTLSRHVAAGNRARMHLAVLRDIAKEASTQETQETLETPPGLDEDLIELVRATVFAVAERQPFWKGAIIRAYRQEKTEFDRAPERTANAFEKGLDDCLPTAA